MNDTEVVQGTAKWCAFRMLWCCPTSSVLLLFLSSQQNFILTVKDLVLWNYNDVVAILHNFQSTTTLEDDELRTISKVPDGSQTSRSYSFSDTGMLLVRTVILVILSIMLLLRKPQVRDLHGPGPLAWPSIRDGPGPGSMYNIQVQFWFRW
jgi:hypothetical protein